MIDVLSDGLQSHRFDSIIETPRPSAPKPVHYVRVRGGLREHLRFFGAFDPSIARKRGIEAQAVRSAAKLEIVEIEPLGQEYRSLRHHHGHGRLHRQWRDQPQLLCPAEPPVHEPLGGPRFRNEAFLQEGRGDAPAGRIEPSRLPAERDQSRRKHRSLPADRAQARRHALDPGGPRREPPSGHDRDQGMRSSSATSTCSAGSPRNNW